MRKNPQNNFGISVSEDKIHMRNNPLVTRALEYEIV